MQLSIALSMVGTLLVMSVAYAASYVTIGRQEIGPTSDSVQRLGMLVTGLYFSVALLATLFVGVIVTHRIAGPAALIEIAVRGLREGDYTRRLTLRKRDHMQSLAAELRLFREEFLEEQQLQKNFLECVGAAIDAEDFNLARSLCRDHSIGSAFPRLQEPSSEAEQEVALGA